MLDQFPARILSPKRHTALAATLSLGLLLSDVFHTRNRLSVQTSMICASFCFHTLRTCVLASPIRSALPDLRYGLRRMPLCQQYLQGAKYSVLKTGLRIPPVLAVRLRPYRGGAGPLQTIPRFSFGIGIIVMHRAPPRLICFFKRV